MKTNLRNVFEASNARDFSSTQLVDEFIWTNSFTELLCSTKNQIILGSRGSGKTALIKMLAHSNLRKLSLRNEKKLDNEKYLLARDIIDSKKFIATYIPLKVEWINSLHNYDKNNFIHFIWSLNLATCARLIDTARSCVEEYFDEDIERTLVQRKICKALSNLWQLDSSINNFSDLSRELERIEYNKTLLFNKEAMGIKLTDSEKLLGFSFHNSLFMPFSAAVKEISRILNIPDNCQWVICLDEAEFLSQEHHQILNTHMRSANEVFFKITTMPYRHHTLSTTVESNINVGHDLEYIYIDKLGTINMNQSASDSVIQDFAAQLFENRINRYSQLTEETLTLEKLLGKSKLAQDTTSLVNDEQLMELINKHCNEPTRKRAQRLLQIDNRRFNDEIGRKLRGILLLRDEYINRIGSSDSNLYSGDAIISRCSDGNPRRLFRLFNHLLNGLEKNNVKEIPSTIQSKRIKSFSHSELEVLKFERQGIESFEFLKTVGLYFKEKTLETPLNSDLPQSFTIDDSIDNFVWELIKTAVDLGLLYPVVKQKDTNEKNLFPIKEGKFSLANCLAPYFNIFPRVGRSVTLPTVLKRKKEEIQMELFNYE